ncbi:Hypothetical protein NGAL_HAMBI2605_62780 [Neorhizobium galegae bv. orientalis]|nr:Hypothetical protein NGAL_HAMBI2605_62780 [Neorhizobium galegae bv. orientalis]
MQSQVQDWSLSEAEKSFHKLLEGAKAGRVQRIADKDGAYELIFTKSTKKERIGDVLSRGGPVED